ncbi:MAG: hypothetical protein SO128_13880 [Clostridium cadaveris]|uniref:SGNH/GDSL hydrolase family protein n=1 Tax=Clostridium cadaveris TaxID=1529 RepID=A0A1I2Q6X5_9CLOT|nr:hypothetical protein [Clostridium cadaveris]MDU4953011.1 hypothetical protein [Clostridium sp.]MDM8313053.1 hypothetical protein [Clostridium cadaveris]MDY4950451.1 hypothetical protein [Clostridium cadaveris]NWK12107.1 hypothetical protein [Clostridium cadaveris]PWL52090.1 MAG: hypothetical protein DBY38_12280 [Clostridium cadaveris]
MRFKNIIKPVAFVGIFLIILGSLSPFFRQVISKKAIEIEPQNTIDYLIIGDSEATTSISPMEIWNKHGFTGYNLGAPAQRLQETYYSLKNALKNQKPQVVLLETNATCRAFGVNGEINKLFGSIFKNNFEVYKNHNKWKEFNSQNDSEKSKRIRTNILRGFRYDEKIEPYTKGPYVRETDAVEKIPKVPMYYLNKIVELCKENDIQLILYTVPSPVNWNYKRYNGIKDFAERNKLPFLDLNLKTEELGIDWATDTYDKGDHLNFFGAQKLTSYIGNYLSENSKLIDHREDEKYLFWNDIWKKYLKITNKN